MRTKPASEETPDEGHTFRFSVECRGSHKVVGDEHHTDAPDFDGIPMTFEVRAWSLHEALVKAADLPFSVLVASLADEMLPESPGAERKPESVEHTDACEDHNHDAGWRVYRCICGASDD